MEMQEAAAEAHQVILTVVLVAGARALLDKVTLAAARQDSIILEVVAEPRQLVVMVAHQMVGLVY
jgi:hypothetical protein